MHHDDQGHDALWHYAVLKGLIAGGIQTILVWFSRNDVMTEGKGEKNSLSPAVCNNRTQTDTEHPFCITSKPASVTNIYYFVFLSTSCPFLRTSSCPCFHDLWPCPSDPEAILIT